MPHGEQHPSCHSQFNKLILLLRQIQDLGKEETPSISHEFTVNYFKDVFQIPKFHDGQFQINNRGAHAPWAPPVNRLRSSNLKKDFLPGAP
jgi:hypothetical protein